MHRPLVILLCPILFGCQTSKPVVDNAKPKSDSNPKLTKPVVRKVWVPEKIEDDGHVMIEGHWRYEIQSGSSWSR